MEPAAKRAQAQGVGRSRPAIRRLRGRAVREHRPWEAGPRLAQNAPRTIRPARGPSPAGEPGFAGEVTGSARSVAAVAVMGAAPVVAADRDGDGIGAALKRREQVGQVGKDGRGQLDHGSLQGLDREIPSGTV